VWNLIHAHNASLNALAKAATWIQSESSLPNEFAYVAGKHWQTQAFQPRYAVAVPVATGESIRILTPVPVRVKARLETLKPRVRQDDLERKYR
jgi:hypothetical protein